MFSCRCSEVTFIVTRPTAAVGGSDVEAPCFAIKYVLFRTQKILEMQGQSSLGAHGRSR